jgi:hypothetical protein
MKKKKTLLTNIAGKILAILVLIAIGLGLVAIIKWLIFKII